MSDDMSSNVGNVSEFGIEMNVEQNGRDAVWRNYHNICPKGLRKNIKILTLNCSHLTVYHVCVLRCNILSHSEFYVHEISCTGQVYFCSDVLNWNILTYLFISLLTYLLTYLITYLISSFLHSAEFFLRS
jgi:hypothetical protein